MKPITDVLEALIDELQKASEIRIKPAWISPGDRVPLITILMHDSELRPIDMSQMMIYELRFQIDIWHTSAKDRDEVFDKILNHFEENKQRFHQDYGWFDIRFTGITDLEEEGVFRKIITLRLRMVA